MTLTVASLLAHPEANTTSLTPGVGEERVITWAHVCELSEPWLWLGEHTLVMTTGIAVPKTAEAQSAYFAGMAEAGIAAIAVDAEVSVTQSALRFAAAIGFPVLATGADSPFSAVGKVVADAAQRASIAEAAQRRDWMFGTMLFNNLLDSALPEGVVAPHLAEQGIDSPFVVAVWSSSKRGEGLERFQRILADEGIRALVTQRDGQILAAVNASVYTELSRVALTVGCIGVSATFSALDVFAAAASQAQMALARTRGADARIEVFDADAASSPFLEGDPNWLASASHRVLDPLYEYDRTRGTELVDTLRIFLEENGSWVRASVRLFVHRQTLASRVARIEKVLGRDLHSMGDLSDCWFAIRAGILAGEIDPHSPGKPV
ncbi:PucR family transcriptional regulator [Rhodococcus sp. NPDC060176]|uniref:PucR family transcriptional regulator n=1 Tax=Rhodococcus sp. NPDC060176 TaxID=3347062 RepID=UPI003664B5E9